MKKLLLLLLLSLGLIVNSSAEDQQSSYKDTLKAEIQALETSLEKVESQAREAEEKAKEIAKKAANLNEEIESKKLLFSKLSSIVTVITIDKDGNYYINSIINSGIKESDEFGAASLNIIVSKVKARIYIYPEMKIFIKADKGAAYGKVIEVIALLQNAGVEKVGFMVENTGKDSSTEQQKLKEQEALKVSEQEALKAKAKKIMAEVQRKAEEAKAKAKLTKEEKDQLSALKSAYVSNIAAQVKSVWNFSGADDNWSCDVYVQQDEKGKVLNVYIQDCNTGSSDNALMADDKVRAFMNSIERAIYKSSPLPIAPDVSVWDKDIMFTFTP